MRTLRRTQPALARYYIAAAQTPRGWDIIDRESSAKVDVVRTALSAESEVGLLNAGRARVNPHACIGCRVVAL